MKTTSRHFLWRYALVFTWLTFTVSLTIWWYIYSQHQLDRLIELDTAEEAELHRNQRMLRMEGFVLIFSIIGGGGTLAYLVFRDLRRTERERDFFLTFSHELKTPLASVRLQAESLQEDLTEKEHIILLERMLRDTDRLGLHIDNALYYANIDNQDFTSEETKLSALLASLQEEYSELPISQENDCLLNVDPVAFRTVLSNLFRNAVVHGKASTIKLRANQNGPNVHVHISDDGRGLRGEKINLSKPFQRRYQGSGTGLGLYLSARLTQHMGGKLSFSKGPKNLAGFSVELSFPGTLV